jgi:Uncharacterized protein conserved in bacteria (DUF2188)
MAINFVPPIFDSRNSIMTDRSRVHVIKRDDGWVVKKDGTTRASKKFTTKEEAIETATVYHRSGHDLVIHRHDGTIEDWTRVRHD